MPRTPRVSPPGTALLLICASAGITAACDTWKPQPIAAASLVGDATCISCHAEEAAYLETAHALTSAPPSRATIHGSFQEGENILRTANPYLHFRMTAREGDFYQTAVLEGAEDSAVTTERIGIVIGSGRKGQSYLHWDGDRLFQLPVSYWRGLGWVNSPGYVDGLANFERPVHPRCLECHATIVESAPEAEASNQYEAASFVSGISCESCHGGGREHVERQTSWSRRLGGQAIVDPTELSRARRLDQCALCHGGIGESVRPPFSYTPGEPLAEYLDQPVPTPFDPVDVHGNQVALLARSPCFQGSEMTCSTCHDVHRTQRDLAEFSAVCTSCHEPGGDIPTDHGGESPGNCVDCHMPELPTNAILSRSDGETVRPRVRTHHIEVYRTRAAAVTDGEAGSPSVGPNR